MHYALKCVHFETKLVTLRSRSSLPISITCRLQSISCLGGGQGSLRLSLSWITIFSNSILSQTEHISEHNGRVKTEEGEIVRARKGGDEEKQFILKFIWWFLLKYLTPYGEIIVTVPTNLLEVFSAVLVLCVAF